MQPSGFWHSSKTTCRMNHGPRQGDIFTTKELWKTLLTQKERDMWLKCSRDIRGCEGLSEKSKNNPNMKV